MANVYTTTADLLQLGDGNISDIDVSELLEEAPLLAALAAQQASHDTLHEWLKKTVAPVVGFRAINDGRENDKATYEKITVTLQLFDASFAIDMGLLQTNNGESLKRREAIDHLQAAFAALERQIIGGTSSDATGFNGFADEGSVDAVADPMVINAGGVIVDGQSDVWAIRSGESSVSAIYGLDAMVSIGQEYPAILPGSTTGNYDGMRTPILFYGGVQVATTQDLVRIANIDTTATLTDAMLNQAYGTFPANRKPNMFAMSRRSLTQLQNSRTATNPTGAEAPVPTTSNGVRIIATDQIGDDGAVLT